MKKWLSVISVVVLCLSLVIGIACGGEEEEEEGVGEVRIGFGIPLGGAYGALIGIPMKNALELANEWVGEFEVDGKSYRWKIVVDDNESSSAGGVATATKFIYDDGVQFMWQFGTDASMAALPITEEAGVLLDGVGITEALGPEHPYFIQICPTGRWNTPPFMKWFSETHPEAETFVTCGEDNETGRMMSASAVDCAEYFGLDVIAEEYFAPGTVEFYPVATRIEHLDPDLAHISPSVLPALHELGWDGFKCYGYWAPMYGDLYGWENLQGFTAYYPVPNAPGMPEALLQFSAEYKDRYGADFTMMPLYVTMTLWVLTGVLEKAGTVDDMDKIMQVIETETIDTPVGRLQFTGESVWIGINRLLQWPVWVGQIQGQEYVIVAEFSAEEAEELAIAVGEAAGWE